MKITPTITVVFLLLNQILEAQLPVSHLPTKKNALIEEFTGIHCQFCPDGHRISSEIIAANPGKAFAVNIHTGGYASPGSGELDFRTVDGDAIVVIPGMGVTGYPTGDVNRHIFPTPTPIFALDRALFSLAVNTIIGEAAYVNIAGNAVLNTTTNLLTVDIEAYYTASSPKSKNKFTVMLLQDNINGTQTGGAQWNPTMVNANGTYRHMHALRDVLTTSAMGDDILNTTAGTTFTKKISYSLPASFKNIPVKVADLELIAFVSEGESETINVCKIPIKITNINTTIVENENLSNLSIYPNPITNDATINFTLPNPAIVSITLMNTLGQVVLYEKLEELSAGKHNYLMVADNIPNGLYTLNLNIGNTIITKKIAINK